MTTCCWRRSRSRRCASTSPRRAGWASAEELGRGAGLRPPPLRGALQGFSPLPHRLETVREEDGILWVDDSISTTPESTLAALSSFSGRDLILIAGGQDRGQEHEELARVLAARGATVIGVPSTGARLLDAARSAGVAAERAIEVRRERAHAHEGGHAKRDAHEDEDDVPPRAARLAPGHAERERRHAGASMRPSRSRTT